MADTVANATVYERAWNAKVWIYVTSICEYIFDHSTNVTSLSKAEEGDARQVTCLNFVNFYPLIDKDPDYRVNVIIYNHNVQIVRCTLQYAPSPIALTGSNEESFVGNTITRELLLESASSNDDCKDDKNNTNKPVATNCGMDNNADKSVKANTGMNNNKPVNDLAVNDGIDDYDLEDK